jgi:hypothetical protein
LKTSTVVVFSFKHYGFNLLRSFNPFLEKYANHFISYYRLYLLLFFTEKVVLMEICFIEYSFLSIAKAAFANNIRNQISEAQANYTVISFGSIAVKFL